MNLIVAVDENFAIGKKDMLLYHLPTDLAYFKEKTSGKIVLMGRKTYESLPGKNPLPGRRKLILTKNPSYHPEGGEVFHTVKDVLSAIENIPPQDVFVIGGAEIYRLFLPYCNKAYLTKIGAITQDADTFFPNLDIAPDWNRIAVSEPIIENNISFTFQVYDRLK